ncbi:MAG: hypothetical protein V7752_19080 [Halopseudomonas sp.]
MASSQTQTVPAWVTQMEAGSWYRISGSQPDLGLAPTPVGTRYLGDNDPALDRSLNPSRSLESRLRRWLGRYVKAPWSGRGDFRSITEAWNSAVLASRFGDSGSMVCFGGGHNNYFGSDVHAFDLATRCWSRISDGYVSGAADAYGAGAVYPDAVYPDGSPLPPHTYQYLQYNPISNELMLAKGQQEMGPDVVPTPIPHLFNFDTLQWRHGPKHPNAALKSGGFSAWDSHRNIHWVHSGDDGDSFAGFSPEGDNDDGSAGSWSLCHPGKLPKAADHNAMAYDSKRDLLLVLVHQHNALYAINPASPSEAAVRLDSLPAIAISPYATIEYCSVLDRFIYYSASEGDALYSITPPSEASWNETVTATWTWQQLSVAANSLNPVRDAAKYSNSEHNNLEHCFGRFRLVSYGKTVIAVLVRHIDSPVYAIKLA